jgi:prepilin-type processing-associated H-X9-DG protein
MTEITDDKGLTLVVLDVDADKAVHWMSPRDASEHMVLSFAEAKHPSHPGGAQAAMVDGSIRFLSKSTRPDALRALISVAGDDDEAARQAD